MAETIITTWLVIAGIVAMLMGFVTAGAVFLIGAAIVACLGRVRVEILDSQSHHGEASK